MLNESIFREYDIRGIADIELTSPVSFSIGVAFVELLSERLKKPYHELKIVIGHDARVSGPRIISNLEAGIHSKGAYTLHLGLAPTPLIYFALCEFGHQNIEDPVHAGIVVTGSHNPPEWNGFKLCIGRDALYGAELQNLKLKVMNQLRDFTSTMPLSMMIPKQKQRSTLNLNQRYAEQLAGLLTFGSRRLKVVVDAGNGALGPCALELFQRLFLDVIPMYCEPNGNFPHHHPDPTIEEHLNDLKTCVLQEGADLGVAFDGDGDRIGVVDDLGRVIWGDQLMIFFARDVLKHAPGARIIGEVKCSQALYDEIELNGGIAEMWRVGHSLIKARMKEVHAPLAGEMSGHIFFADRFYGHDDAAYVAARLFELLSHSDLPLSQWRDQLPQTVTTPELRVDCLDEYKVQIVARAICYFEQKYELVTVDGVRIHFPHGWGLIRASNTQPALVLRFEASTQEALYTQVEEIEHWLRDAAPEVTLTSALIKKS